MVMTICRLMMISTGGCNFLFLDDDSLRSDISYDILVFLVCDSIYLSLLGAHDCDMMILLFWFAL